MFDEQTEAFYDDYLATPPNDYLFGLTTAKVMDDLKWQYAKNRAGTADQIRQWVSDAHLHNYDAHLALGLIPVDVVGGESKYSQRDLPAEQILSRCFVFDFDVYQSGKRKKTDYDTGEQVESELARALKEGLPHPDYIIRSGSGGVHLWYFCNNYITYLSHKNVYAAMVERMEKFGLLVDPQAGSAKKRIRAPGSINHKPHVMAPTRCEKLTKRPRSMRVLQKQFGFKVTTKIAGSKEIEAAHREDNEFDEYGQYPSSTVAVACPYMVYQLATGSSELIRAQWLGVASIVRHLTNWPEKWGEACVREYGDVTQADLEHALDPDTGLAGPASCESIGGGPFTHDACKGCQAHTMVRGGGYPINWIQKIDGDLKAGRPIPTQRQEEAPRGVVEIPEPYPDLTMTNFAYVRRDVNRFILYTAKQKKSEWQPDKPIAFPTFAPTRIENGATNSWLYFDVEGSERRMDMSSMNHHNSLAKALGSAGIRIRSPLHVASYLHEVLELNAFPEVSLESCAGWSDDRQTFTTFESKIRANGPESPSKLEDPPLNGLGLGSAGNVDKWRSAMGVLQEHDAQLLVFATMCGFAAVLPEIASSNQDPPAVVSFYHPDSGKGKSTALRLPNSVFMQAKESNVGSADTDASAYKSFGTIRNIFCSMDEMTSKITDPFFNGNRFVTNAITGYEKGRLSQSSSQMGRSVWKTIVALSTNASLNEALAREDSTQGALARVHEFYFDSTPLPKYVADDLLKVVTKNHGVAGPEFVRQLMLVPNFADVVDTMYERWSASLSGAVATTNSHRYALSLFAYVLTATELTNQFHITEFKVSELFDWCVTELSKRVAEVSMQVQRTEITPSDFFNQVRNDIFSAMGARLYEPENLAREALHPLFYTQGKLYVTNAAFEAWCGKNHRRTQLLNKWASMGYVDHKVKRYTFSMMGQKIAKAGYFTFHLNTFMDKETLDELERLLANNVSG